MSVDEPDKPGLIGQVKDKLKRSKQEWAREGRIDQGTTEAEGGKRLKWARGRKGA